MWNLPGPGLEPLSPALAESFLSTRSPGKSRNYIFKETDMWTGRGVCVCVCVCVCELLLRKSPGRFFFFFSSFFNQKMWHGSNLAGVALLFANRFHKLWDWECGDLVVDDKFSAKSDQVGYWLDCCGESLPLSKRTKEPLACVIWALPGVEFYNYCFWG